MRIFAFMSLILLPLASFADSQCPAFLDYDLPKMHSKTKRVVFLKIIFVVRVRMFIHSYIVCLCFLFFL